MDYDDYMAWFEWYTSASDQQEIEYQQEVEEYPLFFWKETCNYYLNHDTIQAMKTVIM